MSSPGLSLPGLSAESPGRGGSPNYHPSTSTSTPGASGSGSGQGTVTKRKRKPKTVNRDFNRALDENDDISDTEILAVPTRKRRLDEEYDEEEEEDEEEDEDEHDEEDGDDDEEDDEDGEEDHVEHDDGKDGEVDARAEGIGARETGQSGVGGGKTGKKGKKAAGKDSEGGIEKRDKRMKGERIKLRGLLDPEQTARFDAFGTAFIPKQAITKLNREMFDQRVHPNITALIAGMAKVFVADLIELAKDLQPESAHPTGPLQPYHLRLARSILEQRGVLRSARAGLTGEARGRKGMFRR